MALAPPSPGVGISLLTTWYQPPASIGKVAAPSGKAGHSYGVPATVSPARAMTRELNPSGSSSPLASG